MSRWFFLPALWLVIGGSPASGQSRQEDSLRRVARTAPHDTTRAYAWWMLAYLAENNDSTIRLAQRTLRLMDQVEPTLPTAARRRMQAYRASTYTSLAIGYGNQGKTALVEPNYLKALSLQRKIDDFGGQAATLNNLGIQAYVVGDIRRALSYQRQALRLTRRYLKGDKARRQTASCLVDLGVLYFRQGDPWTALRYHQQAAGIYQQLGDGEGQADALYRAATMALHLRDTTRATTMAGQCLAMAEKSANASRRRDASDLLGLLALSRHQVADARAWHQQALRIDQQLGMTILQANDLTALARVECADHHLPLALQYAQQAAQVAHGTKGMVASQNAEQQLSDVYDQLGDTRQALAHYRRYVSLRDSIRNQETEKAALQQRLGYEYEQKELLLRTAQEKHQAVAQAEIHRQKLLRNMFLGGAAVLLLLAALLWHRFRFTRRAKLTIEREKQRSDRLLLNILPADTAEELKTYGRARARHHAQVTVLFADVVNFTQVSERLDPEKLVHTLDIYFAAFDRLSEEFGLEKIKTIGDAYMMAGGLGDRADAATVVRAALAMQRRVAELRREQELNEAPWFTWRIGLHTGPVVAGVVGLRKFAYDIWGDAVNVAARMEQASEPARINISGTTYELVRESFVCTPRGPIAVKNKGTIAMYFVESEVTAGAVAAPVYSTG